MAGESPWLAFAGAAPPGSTPLFCFPHGGGTASVFHSFRRLLAPAFDVVGIELPGRGSRFREPLAVELDVIVDAVAEAITRRARGPFFLYGHSIGTLLAFETTRALVARDHAPAALFVSGRRAPPAPQRRDPDHPALVSTLSDTDLKALLARYAGTPTAVLGHDELMRLYLPVLRHDFSLDECYRHEPGPPLPLPIHAYAGSEDPLATPDELDGWRAMTATTFTVRVFDGGHFFPYERGAPGFCRELAERMRTPRVAEA
ncbi:MAG: thioesterase [Rhodanobacteraceae bacterium]